MRDTAVDFLVNFFGGIVGGVISTAAFLLLLDRFGRPKPQLSPVIAAKNGVLRVKVINKSGSDLFDVQAELKFVLSPVSPDRRSATLKIPLRSEEYMGFRGYRKRDRDAEYAIVFPTDFFAERGSDPRAEMDGNTSRFRLHA